MIRNKRYVKSLILLVISLCIHLYSLDAQRVEKTYSSGIYQSVSQIFRQITRVIPFSVGDIFYALAGIYIISRFLKYGKKLAKREFVAGIKQHGRYKLLKIFNILACLYIFFNLLWGINYNRVGVATQLGIEAGNYSKSELIAVNAVLLQNLNNAKQQLIDSQISYPPAKEIFQRVAKAYSTAETEYPFLTYRIPTVKSSLWGWLGNYMGFTGYYNPFTGEAQVNTNVPLFTQPFTTAHEIAHQIGYAKEMEANFVGFLVSTQSSDPVLLYSGYLDMFLYANRNLYRSDSAIAQHFLRQLLPETKNDLQELRDFARAHKNPIEPIIRWGYDVFLRSNQQPSGLLSYSEVTAFVIAYYKHMGEL